jgi:hypothetical protein
LREHYISGFVCGNTHTANGAAEMIKEIFAHLKKDDLEILFRMDSGYFDDDIIETIRIHQLPVFDKGKRISNAHLSCHSSILI